MKVKRTQKIFFYALSLLIITAHLGYALELHTRYSIIVYNEDKELEMFNEGIYLGKYNFLLQREGIRDVSDEVMLKTDFIYDRVSEILDIYPEGRKVKIIICSSVAELQMIHERIYGHPIDSEAFYAPEIEVLFLTATSVELATVAHEFAHVVMQKYFREAPPVKIHELLSRYVARHIKD